MSDQEREDLIRYRFNKADEALEHVQMLIENKAWNIAINRLYYSCYYAVSALLASIEIYPKSHSGTGQMFRLHYIKTGKVGDNFGEFYTSLFEMRQDSDYEDFVDYEEADVTPLVEPTKAFVNEIRTLLFQGN